MLFDFIILVVLLPEVIKSQRLGIIQGQESEISRFPYQLSLFVDGIFQCGASIISPNYAITAAHCTLDCGTSSISLRAGSSSLNSGGVKVNISNKIEHPQFNIQNFDFDYSILKFEKPLNFSRNVMPVKLPKYFEWVRSGTRCAVSGFGVTENDDISEVLKSTEVKVIDDFRCRLKFAELQFVLTDRMMCAGDENSGKKEGNRDACSGDSGGPLVCDGVLQGIISSGASCGTDYPGIYARVGLARSWIRRNTGI